MKGKLVLIGIHIGNEGDISSRAIDTLKAADYIACEQASFARAFLARNGIDRELLEINEHTEASDAASVVDDLRSGRTVALISDCGMPVFADPGTELVQRAIDAGIPIDVVPGPDSLTAALAVSGIDVQRFLFYGFLSPKRPMRRKELSRLRYTDIPVVFLDAPYRLLAVLDDMRNVLGADRHACVACDVTLPTQHIERGILNDIFEYFSLNSAKREFVIIVAPAEQSTSRKKHARKS